MDWQQAASLAVVAATAFLLIRHEITKRRRSKLRACGHGCGCSSDVLERIKAESQPKIVQKNSEINKKSVPI